MQPIQNKLKEIIWEITNQCYNNCSYCGSKGHNSECSPSDDHIKAIADAIALYPPEEINISGGDPMLISYDTHKYITSTLKDVGCTMKIIVNPKSLKIEPHWLTTKTPKVHLYDVIGLSVNTQEELDIASVIMKQLSFTPVTIITNFNTNNIWIYKNIEAFVKENFLTWQIQYTISKDTSIYDNSEAKKLFFSYIKASNEDNGVKVVLSDNLLNKGPCWAGMNGLGILSTGDVVPCLSMRSWCDEKLPLKGNILEYGLQEIWVMKFAKWRCSEFKCCKDICNAPYEEDIDNSTKVKKYSPSNLLELIENQKTDKPIHPNDGWDRVFVYGVVSPSIIPRPHIEPNIVIMYGVTTGESITYSLGAKNEKC